MTRKLVTVPVGTSLEDAEKVFHEHKIEKLLVVDDGYHLKGLITYKDILKRIQYPDAAKDSLGRLRVGAAVGVGADFLDRARALVAAKCDVIVVDNAHGHSQRVLDTVRTLKKEFPGQELVAGNIGTARAAEELIDLGVDAVKVGVGPGLHLHDPDHHRRRHPPDHGHRRRLRGPPQEGHPAHRRRRHQVLRAT